VTRRVIAQQWISLDGFASGPDGEGDIFAAVEDFTGSEKYNRILLDSVDQVLLGRRSYESFVRFWPMAGGEPMAARVNTVEKVVFSTTLEAAPWGDFAPAKVVRDAVAHVREAKQAPGGALLMWGSLELMRSLMREKLVDELDVFVAPVLLGAGTPLVAPDGPYALTQLDGEVWGSSVHCRYAVNSS
jgi:dihydrofolate reductase